MPFLTFSSSDSVKEMDIERRNCILRDEAEDVLLDNEIELDVYKTYSRRSCLMECRAREMYDVCKCLPYYFPNFSRFWDKNTTCDLDGLLCLSLEISKSVSRCKTNV